jgi:hypothetical protein
LSPPPTAARIFAEASVLAEEKRKIAEGDKLLMQWLVLIQ